MEYSVWVVCVVSSADLNNFIIGQIYSTSEGAKACDGFSFFLVLIETIVVISQPSVSILILVTSSSMIFADPSTRVPLSSSLVFSRLLSVVVVVIGSISVCVCVCSE